MYRYLLAILLTLSLPAAVINSTWTGAVGAWETPTNWDTNPDYPSNGVDTFHAIINNIGADVTLATPIIIDRLSLTVGGLTVNAGGSLTIDSGNSVNLGTLTLAGGSLTGSAGTSFDNSGTLVLDGGVTATLAGGSNDGLIRSATGSNTLRLLGTFASNGTIRADSDLFIDTSGGGLSISGIVIANTGATLTISGGNLSNYGAGTLAGGTFVADGGTIRIDTITTNGANLTIRNGGLIADGGGADALTTLGTNFGSISLQSAGITTTVDFINHGTLALTGSGSFSSTGVIDNSAFLQASGSANTVDATGGVVNNGTITVDNGALAITGGAFNNINTVTLQNGATLTVGAGTNDGFIDNATGLNTLILSGAFVSNGFVQANGGTLTVNTSGGTFENLGTVTAYPGAVVAITGINLQNWNSGTGTLSNGTWVADGGNIRIDGLAVLTNNASITLKDGGQLQNQLGVNGLTGLLNNNGSLTLANSTLALTSPSFVSDGNLDIQNGGLLSFNAPPGTFINNGQLSVATGGDLDVTAATIQNGLGAIFLLDGGSANLTGATINDSTMLAQNGASLNASQLQNNGALVIGGATTTATIADFTNAGIATVGVGGTLRITSAWTNYSAGTGVLSGGAYNISGALDYQASVLNITSLAANTELTLSGDPATLSGSGISNLQTIDGTLQLVNRTAQSFTQAVTNNGVFNSFSSDVTMPAFTNNGFFRMNGGTLTAATLDQVAGVLDLASNAAITGDVVVSGGEVRPTGPITINGNLQVTSGAPTFVFRVLSASNYDQINVTQNILLNGLLTVLFELSYVPTFGEEFILFQSLGLIGGTFASTNIPIGWFVDYRPAEVVLTMTNTGVPEPSTWAMLGAALVALGCRRRRRKM